MTIAGPYPADPLCPYCFGKGEREIDHGPIVECGCVWESVKRVSITLNDYQRRNLLWLLTDVLGWGKPGVYPFTLAHNGDWVGEIAMKLGGSLKPDESANGNAADLKQRADEVVDALRTALESRNEMIQFMSDTQTKIAKALGFPDPEEATPDDIIQAAYLTRPVKNIK